MLTPKEIDEKEFTATRIKEGYDQKEVDDFLDRVSIDYAKMTAEILKLKEQVRKLTDTPTSVINPVSPMETAERLLRLAEKTAQQHVEEAELKADEIVREAGGKAAQAIEEADQAADEMKGKARYDAAQIVSAAQNEAEQVRRIKEQLSEQLTQLEEKRRTYKSWLKSMLEYMEEEKANG